MFGKRLAPLTAIAALSLAALASGQTRFAAASNASCHSAVRSLAALTRASRLTNYDDFIGDSGSAPDFCASEAVTNDNQTITIGIHVHNRDGFTQGDSYSIYLDTDKNPNSGGGEIGAEYQIVFDATGTRLEQWNGTSFVQTGTAPISWIDGYGPVLVVDRAEIGNPTGFNFVLVSTLGQDGDRAPDQGSWAYGVTPLQLAARTLTHNAARAGRLFVARTLVMRSDFEIPLSEGKIACSAKLAGTRLTGTGRFTHDRVACSWHLPTNARGKRLTGAVAVTYQGVQASRNFSLRVR
jgi:hypothetical protein